ncbi:Uncharacterised protein [Mycolicibacterium chitae]|uniref:Uncharacterized protein n=1 Tax=Mycolicibacterium chitae TaxID=1792 RepID=A0A448IDT8_MYCCI|nr:Uncharacterised protein [Mycolicibacterium chitae]
MFDAGYQCRYASVQYCVLAAGAAHNDEWSS